MCSEEVGCPRCMEHVGKKNADGTFALDIGCIVGYPMAELVPDVEAQFAPMYLLKFELPRHVTF